MSLDDTFVGGTQMCHWMTHLWGHTNVSLNGTFVGGTNVSLDDVEEIFDTSILSDNIVHRLEGKRKTWQDLSTIRKTIKKA